MLMPKPSRILVVEDDRLLSDVMMRVVSQVDRDARIEWVITAERAMSMLESRAQPNQSPYDLVIADIGLPGEATGMDLWAYCQREFPEMPFVFSSGVPVDEFLRRFGPHDICPPYLAKPFSTGECKQVVQAMLEYRRWA